MRPFSLVFTILALALLAGAQTQPRSPARKASTWRRYCQPHGGFCFRYPSSWVMQGEVFDGNGVVVAPPQKQQRELWDEITVSLIVPPPEGDEEPTALDALLGQAVASLRENADNVETLQRQQRTVDDQPAQMLKVRYRDKAAHDWLEELVFIEGPDNEIYSVALKCAPENLAHLEPVFTRVLESWKLPEPPPADDNEQAAPRAKTD